MRVVRFLGLSSLLCFVAGFGVCLIAEIKAGKSMINKDYWVCGLWGNRIINCSFIFWMFT